MARRKRAPSEEMDEAAQELYQRAQLRDVTLQSQQRYYDLLPEGSPCPCCMRSGKLYSRPINAGQARSLIWLYRNLSGDEFIHVAKRAPRYVLSNRELPRLQFWGLVESKPNAEDPDKRDSGLWRMTDYGRKFVEKRSTVPLRGIFYDRELVGFEGPRVTIDVCLGKKFSYAELMGWGSDE